MRGLPDRRMARVFLVLIPVLALLAGFFPASASVVPPLPAPVNGFSSSELSSSTPIPVIVGFKTPPAAEAEIAANSQKVSWTIAEREQAKAGVAARQDQILQRIAAAGIPATIHQSELFGAAGNRVLKETRFTYLYSGARLTVPGNLLRKLSGIQGVTGVFDDRPQIVPLLDGSVPYTQAPGLWAAADIGNEGEGQVIAVIDSGIDWNHPMFNSDYPLLAGFPPGPEEGCNEGAPTCVGTHEKVIYAVSINAGPSPYDAVIGHGTHVSSIAAGDSDLGDAAADPVLKGTAPAALLMAFKTLSDAGVGLAASSTTAMEDAAQDTPDHPKADVMNLSLGSLAPNNAADQPQAIAADNASQLGVVMAIAAGNCGATGNALCPDGREGAATTSAPGTSRLAISVGASANPESQGELRATVDSTDYPANMAAVIAGDNSFTPPLTLPFIFCGPSRVLTDCGTPPTPAAGMIALIQVTPPTVYEQAKDNAEAAGAAAVVFINTKAVGPPAGTGDEPFAGSVTQAENGPVFGVSFNTGEAIKTAGFATLTPTAGQVSTEDLTFDYEPASGFEDFTADFSSRGPLSDFTLKPDVAAPGINILAAMNDSGGYVNNSGTSMASPHVAGLAALLLGAHPGWGPTEVRTALMNTAAVIGPSDPDPSTISITEQGSGAVRVLDAAKTPSLLTPPSFSFGQVVTPAAEGKVSYQKFRLSDVRPPAATGDQTYTLSAIHHLRLPNSLFGISFRAPSDIAGPPITAVVVPNDGTVDFLLRVEVSPALPESPKDTTPAEPADDYINFEGYEFFIVADPVGTGTNLHAPVFYRHVNTGVNISPPATSAASPILEEPGEATNNTGSFGLDWNDVPDAEGYVVEESANCNRIFPLSDAENSTVPSDDETWGSDGGWTVSDVRAHSGTSSFFSGQGPLSDSTLASNPLAGARTLSFWEFLDTEPDFDFARVRATFPSTDPQVIRQVSGLSNGWREVTVHDVPDGAAGLELNYSSDENTDLLLHEGWYVDDVLIHSGDPWVQIAQPTASNFTVTGKPDGSYCYRIGSTQQVGENFVVTGYSNLGDIVVDAPLPGPYWYAWDIAVDIELLPGSDDSGYVMDGFGALHAFGFAPIVVNAPYFANLNVARGFELLPGSDTEGVSGYVLDAFGTVRRFSGGDHSLPAQATGYPNFPGGSARDLEITGEGEGYVLDSWGGVHSYGGASPITGGPYWNGWDIARDLEIISEGEGYVLDGFGAVHAAGGAGPMTGGPYWSGWDIARDLEVTAEGAGQVLDGWGGIHKTGSGPVATGGPYFAGWDIARDLEHFSGGGIALDGWGGRHLFGI